MEGEEPNEMEKDLIEHEVALSYMKSRLEKYQQSEERLFVENINLKNEMNEQKTNFKDITEYLELQLKKKTEQIQALETCKADLENSLKQLSCESEAALSKLQTEKEALQQELQRKINEFNKKIRGTQEFLSQKEELEEELRVLKQTMEETTRQQERKLTDMERSHLQDRENWKREVAKKVKEAKAQMMQLTDNQLELTTKRTIMENEQMASELAYQSKQTENMLHNNDILLDENSSLKRQIELSKETQDEFAKRNLVYQKTIHRLLCKMREDKIEKTKDEENTELLRKQCEQETARLQRLRLKLEEREETIKALSEQCSKANETISLVTCEKEENARFLLRCMEDIKKKTVTVVQDSVQRQNEEERLVLPGRLEDLSTSQREQALSYLLRQLGLAENTHVTNTSKKKDILATQKRRSPSRETRLCNIRKESS